MDRSLQRLNSKQITDDNATHLILNIIERLRKCVTTKDIVLNAILHHIHITLITCI